MTRHMILLLLLLGATGFGNATKRNGNHQNHFWSDERGDERDGYTTFASELRPYGEWIDCNYGRVWRPLSVELNWRPYRHGRWIWTDYGWYWSSYEPFGWAVFHYGRWEYDDYYGWIWVPDNVWGPAWVEWRYDDTYIGWAPLTLSASFNIGIGVTLTHGWRAPLHYWNFIPCRNFTTAHVSDYVQPIEQTRRFFGNTRSVANIRTEQNRIVNRGVDVRFIERKMDTRIDRITLDKRLENRDATPVRESRRESPGADRARGTLTTPATRSEGTGPALRSDSRDRQPTLNNGSGLPTLIERQPASRNTGNGIRNNSTQMLRQFRESEQRFELPRNTGREQHSSGAIFDALRGSNSRSDRSQNVQPQQTAPSQKQEIRGNQNNGSAREQQSGATDRPRPGVRSSGRRP